MDEDRQSLTGFWLGFILAAVAVGVMYWYWRTRPVLPPPGAPPAGAGHVAVPLASRPGGTVEVEVRRKDRLELIQGIGPVYARRLNEAGIYSFTDLAALTVDELRDRIGLAEWQGNPADWIAQARALSS